MVIESGCWHSHDIAVDALHTGFQQQDFDLRILRKPTGKNTASCACPNYKTTISSGIVTKVERGWQLP